MIYIDVSAAVHSKAGLGRYSESLAQAIVNTQPDHFSLFYNRGRDGVLPETLQGIPRRQVSLGYKPWRMAVLLGQMARVGFNRLAPDATLFHSTEHLLLPLRNVPTILTVHDLIYKLYPDYHKKLNYVYLNRAMPLFCRRAGAIIAVSEATKRDIVSYYGTDPAKIHVVYEAAAGHFRPPARDEIARVRQQYQLPARFLLHLGTIEPRKNLERLVDVFMALYDQDKNLGLILAGAKGWLYDDFFARIKDDGLESVVRPLGWVPDEDLPALIGAASLAVQPSLYEGFGLPILEHMACGQVVVASNSASHPEVGGKAAVYFPPTESFEMAKAIAQLLNNKNEYARRRMAGLKQAKKFSWSRAAAETIAIYNQQLAAT